mgnify:CR=1 FL=1
MEEKTEINLCGQTNIKVGTRVKIVKNIHGTQNDDCLIGRTGIATHPFASGCTDAGWIGIRMEEYSPYGTLLNMHESEIEIIDDFCACDYPLVRGVEPAYCGICNKDLKD